MKQGLLSWNHCQCPPFLSATLNPKLPRPRFSRISATLNSVDENQLTARERRQLRNERRASNGNNWKEEVETRLLQKPKKRFTSWMDELNLDNLALLGRQWWSFRVPRVKSHVTIERLTLRFKRDYPDRDIKVHFPVVQKKKILKNGSISVKQKPLFPGCVFLQCELNKELHDFIRGCEGFRGFFGAKVGNTKRQIYIPRPMNAADVAEVFTREKKEQEIADKEFEEEQQRYKEASDAKKLLKESNAKMKAARRGRKSTSLKSGTAVQIISGAFAGYSGTVKKLDRKTGLAIVGFTLLGKETLADIDVNELLPETEVVTDK